MKKLENWKDFLKNLKKMGISKIEFPPIDGKETIIPLKDIEDALERAVQRVKDAEK